MDVPLTDGWLVGAPQGAAVSAAVQRYGQTAANLLPHFVFLDAYNMGLDVPGSCLHIAKEMGRPFHSPMLDHYWDRKKRQRYFMHLSNNIVIQAFLHEHIDVCVFIGLLRSMMTELLRPTINYLMQELDGKKPWVGIECDKNSVELMLRGNQLDLSYIKPNSLHPEGDHSSNRVLGLVQKSTCYIMPKTTLELLDKSATKDFATLKTILCAIMAPSCLAEVLCLDKKEIQLLVREKKLDSGNIEEIVNGCVSALLTTASQVGAHVIPMTCSRIESMGGVFDVTRCPELKNEENIILLLNPPGGKKRKILCRTPEGVVATFLQQDQGSQPRALRNVFFSILGSYGNLCLASGYCSKTSVEFKLFPKKFQPHDQFRIFGIVSAPFRDENSIFPIWELQNYMAKCSLRAHTRYGNVRGASSNFLFYAPDPSSTRHRMLVETVGSACAVLVAKYNCLEWMAWARGVMTKPRNVVYTREKKNENIGRISVLKLYDMAQNAFDTFSSL